MCNLQGNYGVLVYCTTREENGASTDQEINNAFDEVGIQCLLEPWAQYEHGRSRDSSQNRTLWRRAAYLPRQVSSSSRIVVG